ncbi:MAG: efflux RND transporter periplasmic adaptor subunit [Betaproteobacteria bacterium]|nr:efflux RND transporter periplasmic adaptor subunit [Betaproteobacteria bacterium]
MDVYPGEVRARQESDHAFRVGGKIVARLVDPGARVARGQALARLDPSDTKLTADAALASVSAAETEAQFSEAEYVRFQDLFKRGFVSQSALDQKLNVANAAKARLESARAQARVSQNQAGYTTLTAEFDGVVTQALGEAGQVVGAGQAVLRVANPANKELLIHVPESKIAEFRTLARGAAAKETRVAMTSEPARTFHARVREIGAAADPVTRTYPVRLSITQSGEAVQLGMSGFAVLANPSATDTLHVPLSAVLVKGNQSGVFRLSKEGKLTLVPVTVVQFTETAAIIKGTLAQGDHIVAAGVHKLKEGDVVKPLDDPRITGDGKVAVIPDDTGTLVTQVMPIAHAAR